MNLWVVGLDYKSAALESRAKAIFQDLSDFENLTQNLDEKFLLSTCNRVEVYGVSEAGPEEFLKRWKRFLGSDDSNLFQIHRDRDAIDHLFRVGAGLESMVLGETQISGQLRKAYQDAANKQWLGPLFHRICQWSFKAAKRVRSETEVGQFAVSIPSVGVKLAEKILGDLQTKRVGVVGLGDIGRVAAEHFSSIGPKKILLFNRTQEVTQALVHELIQEGVRAEPARSIDQIFLDCEVIVSSVPSGVISKEQIRCLEDRQSPVFVLDMGVPPSIDRIESQQVFLFYVDDLKKVSEENFSFRKQELDRAEAVIFEEVERCWNLLRPAGLNETFKKLSDKVEKLRAQELESLRSKLPSLSASEWAEIEKMADRLGARILQDPILEIKSMMDQAEKENWLKFFRNIFRI